MASEETINFHKAHMSKHLSQFTGEQKSTTKIISEDKFIKIVDHLKSPDGMVDLKLHWWAQIKNMQFPKLPHDLEITFFQKMCKFQDQTQQNHLLFSFYCAIEQILQNGHGKESRKL